MTKALTRAAMIALAAAATAPLSAPLATNANAEVTIVQRGGGSVTVRQNGQTVYDRTVTGQDHVYRSGPGGATGGFDPFGPIETEAGAGEIEPLTAEVGAAKPGFFGWFVGLFGWD